MEKKVLKNLEELDCDGVVQVLERWDMNEFVEIIKEKQLDGRKLLNITEALIKLWQPKANAIKLISFIENVKLDPHKYVKDKQDKVKEASINSIENQYQVVTRKKSKEENGAVNTNSIEDIFKRLVPLKSFLYRNQRKVNDTNVPFYLPMDGAQKKPKRFFRLSSYEYPFFDLKSRFSKQENATDRGYYLMKRNSIFHHYKTTKKPEVRTKYKSLPADEMIDNNIEEHLYEDLNYNEIEKTKLSRNSMPNQVIVKPCIVKIQELFQSFRMPFFKRVDEVIENNKVTIVEEKVEKVNNIYENEDGITNMYDSVHITAEPDKTDFNKIQTKLPVEEYLEPNSINREYCDVTFEKQKEESLLGYILSIFEHHFGIRKETNDGTHSEESDTESHKGACSLESGKRPDERRGMADRPLPIPVENEPYYMNIDRTEAENLLMGQPDGAFVLRPSSQPNHAYTLSVTCGGAVHNVGVRRRTDGRLALGFSRKGERCFSSVTSLLRHHKKRRLMLVAGGGVLGATTLNDTPVYYQTPSSIPVPVQRLCLDK